MNQEGENFWCELEDKHKMTVTPCDRNQKNIAKYLNFILTSEVELSYPFL